MAHNVRLANAFSVVETASMSMRSGDVLSVYILLLSGDRIGNRIIGFVQGINGVLQVRGRACSNAPTSAQRRLQQPARSVHRLQPGPVPEALKL